MLRALALGCALTAAAAVLSFRPIYEPDLWWHLAQGRETVSGHIPRTNLFSFTYPDYRQHYTSWLFDAIAYASWTAGGAVSIQILQTVCLAATLALISIGCRTRAPAWSGAAMLCLAFFILEPRAIPRPHLVSFVGLAACAVLVERAAAQRSWRPLRWTVPLVAVWSNFHVECVFGVALIGIFALAELARPSSLTRRDAGRATAFAALCLVATCANPYGWGLLAYLYENLSVPRILAIAELRPPYLPDYRAVYLYLGILAVALISCGRSLPLRDGLTALVFGIISARYLRLSPLVAITTMAFVASRMSALTARGIDRRAILVTAFCAALTVSRIPIRLLASSWAAGADAVEPPQFFSRAAVAVIEQHRLEGPVFNSHNLGGYLAWHAYPRVRVTQDSRLQAYPPDHFRGIIDAYESQPAWEALVAPVDWAVLSVPRPNQLSGAGRFPAREWGTLFEDRAMEILVRRTGKYGALVNPPAPR